MNAINIVAVIITEGSRLFSEYLRIRPRPKPEPLIIPEAIFSQEISEQRREELPTKPSSDQKAEDSNLVTQTDEKIQKGTACLPCTNSHLHACVGLLNEATRFAKTDGLSEDAMKRVDSCLGEIVAAERMDLSPENTNQLPPGEKKIADYASVELRGIRHDLEGLRDPQQLEQIASHTAKVQHDVAKEWFKYRISQMSPDEKARVKARIVEKSGERISK